MITKVAADTLELEPEDNKNIQPFFDYLDKIDFSRDLIKEELRDKIFRKLQRNDKEIASILLREVKKQDGKAVKELNKLIITPVRRIAQKYFNAAIAAADELSEIVFTTIMRQRAKKAFDWVEGDFPLKEESGQRTIKNQNGDKLVAALNTATNNYVIQTKDLLSSMLLSGTTQATARNRIRNDIAQGQQETGTFFNSIARNAQSYIFKVADQAFSEAMAFNNIRNKMRWVTFFTKSCPDCVARHNRIQSFELWEGEGVPRSGVTVCRGHCHCILVPDEYPVNVADPVPRERARIEQPRARIPAPARPPKTDATRTISDILKDNINKPIKERLEEVKGNITTTEATRKALEKFGTTPEELAAGYYIGSGAKYEIFAFTARGFTIEATLQAKGEIVISLDRTLNLNKGTENAKHEVVNLEKPLQAKNMGKNILKNIVPLYEKLKIKEIELQANIKEGSYVWAKAGFEATNKTAITKFKKDIKAFIGKENKQMFSTIDKLKTMQEIANLELPLKDFNKVLANIPEKKFTTNPFGKMKKDTEKKLKEVFSLTSDGNVKMGKVFLIGREWEGIIKTDSKNYSNFKKYIGAEAVKEK